MMNTTKLAQIAQEFRKNKFHGSKRLVIGDKKSATKYPKTKYTADKKNTGQNVI